MQGWGFALPKTKQVSALFFFKEKSKLRLFLGVLVGRQVGSQSEMASAAYSFQMLRNVPLSSNKR